MIIPARGKILVEMHSLTHPTLQLPETAKKPDLSIAEIVNGNGSFITGELVLVPTMAGLNIVEDDIKYRLVNELDIIARVTL